MKPTTISGKIVFSGEGTVDGELYNYGPLEIQTADGLVELPQVVVHKTVQRALTVGSTVALSVSESTDKQGKPMALIWGAYDYSSKRAFFNEEMTQVASSFKSQLAFGIVMTLVGLLFFVVPGLLIGWQVLKAMDKAKQMPTADEMRAHVNELSATPQPSIGAKEPVAA
ncbi:hypothetical protein [Methylibium petroleiphilum]|uniref:Transmembrane protein n=1 Tax=Methylibium petroleiphilum (strain ATCC BAA-1232 / LMG 22953 / PM1) TaxID=420662 RepID=A2SN97_METPP|nr:hypothetical protein [Methylibium petroleiphilum]ABM97036.1 hypothetical protein Mpe_B0261 [Methylibium petroleiphilum PM1]